MRLLTRQLLPWLCAAGVFVASQPIARSAEASARASTPSRSAGLPWDGRLHDSVKLHQSNVVRYLPEVRAEGNFYGTHELVGMLQRVAESVAGQWSGSRLSVGELSARNGGYIRGHHSHRSGRDADLAFFMRDPMGGMERFWRFVAFGRDGVATEVKRPMHFDDARNWAVVAQMLRDPEARVQYVFVSRPIRTRLLMQGRRQGESDEFLRSAAAVLIEPKHGHRHENHFHVRIFCAGDDRPECVDAEPYWPWYEGAPPGGVHAELPIIRWRTPATERRRIVVREALTSPPGVTPDSSNRTLVRR